MINADLRAATARHDTIPAFPPPVGEAPPDDPECIWIIWAGIGGMY